MKINSYMEVENINNLVFLVTSIGGVLSLGIFIWYYASLGKSISSEEKEAGKDLTHKINPFTGSSKNRDK